MNKKDMIEKLIDTGYSKDEIKNKSLKEIKEIFMSISVADGLLEESKPNDITNNTISLDNNEIVHSPSDKDWTEYVLSLLDEDREIDNGNPKTDGLRRVAEQLYGSFSILTDIVDSPNTENNFRAVVKVRLQFRDGRIVDGSTDVYSGNTENLFARHAVATAETRAEGRALRKALRLTKVLVAEELQPPDKDEPTGIDGRAPTEMISTLKIMGEKIKVDLIKLANLYKININQLEDLTQQQGLVLCKVISEVQSGKAILPEEIKF